MQLGLILIAALGSTYFIVATRRLDSFTVAWFSAILYFLPGIVGYTLSPVTPASPIKLPVALDREAMGIMLAVLAALVTSAVIWDKTSAARTPLEWSLANCARATDLALVLAIVGVILTIVETRGAAFSADKRIVISAVGRGHLLWQMSASLAATLAFAYRRRFAQVAAWVLLLLDMYIGFRYAFALSFLACALTWGARLGPTRLLSVPKRYLVATLLGGLAIISYQNLKEPIRQQDWQEVGVRLSNPLWYAAGLLTSEPFTTQTVLNEIVRRDFRTGPEHLWSATQHLLVFSPELGAEPARFSDIFQPALFPEVDHGLANSIWAQMWSAGGWPLLLAFIFVFCVVLATAARILTVADPAIASLCTLSVAYWAFYIHRNELLVQAGYQKQVVLVGGACILGSWILSLGVSRLVDAQSPTKSTA